MCYHLGYKNLFNLSVGLLGSEGLIVILLVHVKAPIISIILIINVILGSKVFNSVSFIKKQSNFGLTNQCYKFN